MAAPWTLILLVAAFVLFVLAAIPWPPIAAHQLRLVAAGLACEALARLLHS